MKSIQSMTRNSVVIGLSAMLLLGSFGVAIGQTTSSSTQQASAISFAAFARDLTIGAQGTDVTQLQTFLISQGFAIPAGATGYFGTQTKAAVAAFQAAHGISPAAGYFGPITRAKVNSMQVVTPPSVPDTNDDASALKGREADLRNFSLISGDDLFEGDTDTEVASVRFDVRGGDIRVQRVTLEATAKDSSLNTQPWRYLESLAIYDGSKKIGSIDADRKGDWDRSGTTYSIDIPVNGIIREGTKAELSIRADAVSSIDSANEAQTFSLVIPNNGIRAVDAVGIQQYAGTNQSSVTFGFAAAQSGDLLVRSTSSNPDAGVIIADTKDSSDKTNVLVFEIRNKQNADVELNELTVRVDAAFAGSAITDEDVDDIVRRATLTLDGKTYTGTVSGTDSDSYEGAIVFNKLRATVDGNDTVTGKLAIELFGSSNRYDPGATLSFDLLSSDIDAEGERTGNASRVAGTATGNGMTIVTDAGISVAGRSSDASLWYNSTTASSSYGTFTLKFDVTASGDDVFIPRTIALDSASSTYAGVHMVNIGADFQGNASAWLSSTAKVFDANYYIVREGDTETFTVQVVADPNASGYYQYGLDFVQFSSRPSDFSTLQKLDVNQDKAQYRTDSLYIPS